MISQEEKEIIYLETKRRLEADLEAVKCPERARCLFWTLHGIDVIREHGTRAIVQAGSAFFPLCRPDQDDGTMNTHFGYQWSPNELPSLISRANGWLPEMHVWIGLPRTQEIVDFTTQFQPAQAEVIGEKWIGDPPPKYLWGKVGSLFDAMYEPEAGATLFVLKAVAKLYSPERARKLVS